MKKQIFTLFIAVGLQILANFVSAQVIQHSWDGKGVRPNQHCRMLNLFINVIYDVHTDTNNVFTLTDWPAVTDPNLEGVNNAGIPNYLLDFADTAYVPGHLHGVITRLYGESSFDSLQLTGDFVVVNVRESSVLRNGAFMHTNILKTAVDLINANGGLRAIYGHNKLSDYGNPQNGRLTYTNVLIRNITKQYGGLNQGSGINGQTVQDLLIENRFCSSQNGTLQCVGSGNIAGNPTSIVVHEISHSLFGDNSFHTSGGNHRGWGGTMSFPNIQHGYGLMGSAGSSLVGCNGYERWRMHWKYPESCDYIAARNAASTLSIPSDIGIEDGEVTFLLRDFVTYGDAVRIKMPYKDSVTSSNQYIWLENHQIGSNGKLDFLQYSNESDCRPAGAAGIYAYYQVGRDQLVGDLNQVWDGLNRDNLKIISAEGYYDYEKQADSYNLGCVSYDTHDYTLVRTAANPFCGAQDQQCHFFPATNDSVLKVSAEYNMWRKKIGQMVYDNLPCLGDTMDAFTTHIILNMGTNPSTCNAITCHSSNFETTILAQNSSQDTRTTYLSGLRIEMTPQANGDFLVNIRWDDYNIAGDTRWTGTIALKDTARLAKGKTITLAQNRTVVQVTREAQTGLFATATAFTCKQGSCFELDSNSTLLLTENSTFHLDSASRLVLKDGASVLVQSGCTFYANSGADLILSGSSTIIVDSGGKLCLKDTMRLDSSARIIVRPGGKLIVDGGTLTSASYGKLWEGICVEGNRYLSQSPQNQGVVILRNGAVIENARNAIRNAAPDEGWLSTGGIVYADSVTFRNNIRSVEFLSYADTLYGTTIRGYLSHFNHCNFIVDTDNVFTQNNVTFSSHVALWDVNGVKFNGCSFNNNLPNSVSNRGKAIYSVDAGLVLKTECNTPSNLTASCQCPSQYATYNTFNGFSTAVEVATTGHQFGVTIDEAQFDNNETALSINGNQCVSVTRCDFNLNNVPGSAMLPVGLVLNNSTGYQVEENSFHRTAYIVNAFAMGIVVNNSGNDNNGIYRNSFSNLNSAVYALGSNGTFARPSSGLVLLCNDFTGNGNDLQLAQHATINPIQGSVSKGADNSFVSTRNYSLYAPSGSYTYYHSSGFSPAGVQHFTMVGTAMANGCASTLCNSSSIQQPDLPRTTTPSTATYQAIRNVMCDAATNLESIESWYASMQGISSRYAEAETQLQRGRDNTQILHDIVDNYLTTTDERDEYDNYSAFVALKKTIVDWPTANNSQIGELQRIADRNTGRSSEMAKEVLCFFFNICHDRTWQDDLFLQPRSCNTDETGYMPVLRETGLSQNVIRIMSCYNSDIDTIAPNILGCCSTIDYEYVAMDTVSFNGKDYVRFSVENGYEQDVYLREDVSTGKLYRYYDTLNQDLLLCDMTLQEGDTFEMPNLRNACGGQMYLEAGLKVAVSSVYQSNGRKVICFQPIDLYESLFYSGIYGSTNMKLQFIEGIGPTYGLAGPQKDEVYWTRGINALLCASVKDSLIYEPFPSVNCFYFVAAIPEHKIAEMNLYPNPAHDRITLALDGSNSRTGSIEIIDVAGVVVWSSRACEITDKRTIDVSNLTPGLYLVRYSDEDGMVIQKFVKE